MLKIIYSLTFILGVINAKKLSVSNQSNFKSCPLNFLAIISVESYPLKKPWQHSHLNTGLWTGDKGQGTGDKGQGTRDKRQGTRDKGRGKRDKGQGTMDKGQGTMDKGQKTRDNGLGTRDKRQGTRDKG